MEAMNEGKLAYWASYNHEVLYHLIKKHGEKFPKKHGNWIRLNLNGDWFLEMDSWNGYVTLKQGNGEPKNKPSNPLFNDVCGFQGKKWLFLGGKNTSCFDSYYGWKYLGVKIYAMINRIIAYQSTLNAPQH